MRIKNLDGATSMGHGGETYEADADGMFDVPHEVGEALVGFPHWVREHEYLAQTAAAKSAADKDPQTLGQRVAALEAVLPSMQARIAELEELVDDLQTASAAAGDDASQDTTPRSETEGAEAPEKPARPRKTTASQRRK